MPATPPSTPPPSAPPPSTSTAQPVLPGGGAEDAALLVRTGFDDEPGWQSPGRAGTTPSPEGFLANVDLVDLEPYRDTLPENLQKLLPTDEFISFFFVADHHAITDPDHPVLVVPVHQPQAEFLDDPPRERFRVLAATLWSVENNLSLGNMDWDDFTHQCQHGVFRGF